MKTIATFTVIPTTDGTRAAARFSATQRGGGPFAPFVDTPHFPPEPHPASMKYTKTRGPHLTTTENFVVASHLRKSFGSILAVDDVSFSIRAQEIFGLLGPNGAGKTTTIRMLSTVLQSDDGDVTIGGHSVSRRATRSARSSVSAHRSSHSTRSSPLWTTSSSSGEWPD